MTEQVILTAARDIRRGSIVRLQLDQACGPETLRIIGWLLRWDALPADALKLLTTTDRAKLVLAHLDERYAAFEDPRRVIFTAGPLWPNIYEYFESHVLPFISDLVVTNGQRTD